MRHDTAPGRPADPRGPMPRMRESSCGARIAEVVAGPALCAVRVWNQAEWASLPEADRPRTRAHFPGLGWVGAVPIAGTN